MGLIDFLFGSRSKKISEFIGRDAVILDVRTKAEFKQGAITGSKNIPLQQLGAQLGAVKKWGKPVITCCASGMRSSSAARYLKDNGIEAVNGGGWRSLQGRL